MPKKKGLQPPLIKPEELKDLSPEEAGFLSLVYKIFQENQDLRGAYDRLLSQTIQALMRCLEERDAYTYGHSLRVMEYALLIGKKADLKESELRNLELAAMFHDLGKIGVADCVLLKPERLDDDEEGAIQKHPEKSAAIVSIIDEFKNIVTGVRHHHERIDGLGYPDQLSGGNIPLLSRIILVGDTFDAMTTTRPYRKALPIGVAYEELERYSGTQFDPEFVKIFLREHKKLMAQKHQKKKKAA